MRIVLLLYKQWEANGEFYDQRFFFFFKIWLLWTGNWEVKTDGRGCLRGSGCCYCSQER